MRSIHVAVLYAENTQNELNLPIGWPVRTTRLADGEELPVGWSRSTDLEINSIKEYLMEEYNSTIAGLYSAVETSRLGAHEVIKIGSDLDTINQSCLSLITQEQSNGYLSDLPDPQCYGVAVLEARSNVPYKGASLAAFADRNLSDIPIYIGYGLCISEFHVKIDSQFNNNDWNMKFGFESSIFESGRNKIVIDSWSRTNTWCLSVQKHGINRYIDTKLPIRNNTWYKLKIVIDSGGDRVDFYIDDNYKGAVTDNIPSVEMHPLVSTVLAKEEPFAKIYVDYAKLTLYRES